MGGKRTLGEATAASGPPLRPSLIPDALHAIAGLHDFFLAAALVVL